LGGVLLGLCYSWAAQRSMQGEVGVEGVCPIFGVAAAARRGSYPYHTAKKILPLKPLSL